MLKKTIRDSDVIIEVVDARNIEGTRNPKLEKWISEKLGKELMIVASKSDLVDEEALKHKLKSLPFKTAYFSYSKRKGAGSIKKLLYVLSYYLKKKANKDKIKVGIVGYANIGKSSLIDLLVRGKKAKNSPVPGFTRGVKWIKLRDDILLIDTPGIFENKELAVDKCNIDPEKTETLDYVIDFLENYRNKLSNLEELTGTVFENPLQFLKDYAKKRGFIKKGGELDLERAAKEIVRLWNQGKLRVHI
ncbi:MAG: hypothetical protein GXN99_03300 [Candidatus Nanohaloarchaeota archaeon]|nr:hypothetical protein [Candidatus Nanohaloarchaeota archaeon]